MPVMETVRAVGGMGFVGARGVGVGMVVWWEAEDGVRSVVLWWVLRGADVGAVEGSSGGDA